MALPGCRHTLCTDCVRWCFFTDHHFPYPVEMDPLQHRRVDWLNEQKKEARCPVCSRPVVASHDRIRFRGRSPYTSLIQCQNQIFPYEGAVLTSRPPGNPTVHHCNHLATMPAAHGL